MPKARSSKGTGRCSAPPKRAHVQYIPVRWRGSIVAVVLRETRLTLGRRIGELEHHYISLFDRFAHMIAEGTFPFRQDNAHSRTRRG